MNSKRNYKKAVMKHAAGSLWLPLIIMLGLFTFPVHGVAKENDSAEMVLVPGGRFVMGTDSGYPDQRPRHEVYIDAFYIDVHEVTNGQYAEFVKDSGYSLPDHWMPEVDRPDEPVVGVSWHDATEYAKWAGKRLPTEAEWEYAANGGSVGLKYPWGDQPDLNYANVGSFGIMPVKSLKPNGYGIYDMIGNVWEWCSDWYGKEYYKESPEKNPGGPSEGENKVLRGWAWYCDKQHARTAKRFYSHPASKSYNYGFRCVRSVADHKE